MSENKDLIDGLDDLLAIHKKFDDMVENTPLKKEDAILEVISLCTGWLKKNKILKEDIIEIVLDSYEEWPSEETSKANTAIASKIKALKNQLEQQE